MAGVSCVCNVSVLSEWFEAVQAHLLALNGNGWRSHNGGHAACDAEKRTELAAGVEAPDQDTAATKAVCWLGKFGRLHEPQ